MKGNIPCISSLPTADFLLDSHNCVLRVKAPAAGSWEAPGVMQQTCQFSSSWERAGVLQPSWACSSKEQQFRVLPSGRGLQLWQGKKWPCSLLHNTHAIEHFCTESALRSLRSLCVCVRGKGIPTYLGEQTEASQGILICRSFSNWWQFRTDAQSHHPETQPFMMRSRELLGTLHQWPY